MIRDRRASTALEFVLAAPVLMVLLFGAIEYARLVWTMQALQLAGDQTARCVAIMGSACASPAAYAVSTATGFGALGLQAANVTIDNTPPATTNAAACSPASGNLAVRVQLSLAFTSVAAGLLPGLGQTLKTSSCFSITGN